MSREAPDPRTLVRMATSEFADTLLRVRSDKQIAALNSVRPNRSAQKRR